MTTFFAIPFFGTHLYVSMHTVVMLAGGILLGKALMPKKPERAPTGIKGKLSSGANVPLSFLMGKYATAGKLEYDNTWGEADKTPNAYITQVISLSDIPIQSLDKVFVNGANCTLESTPHASYGKPVTEYSKDSIDYLWIKFYDGTQTTADSYLTGTVSTTDRPWNSTAIGKGVAYAIVTARINRELFTGFPQVIFECTGMGLTDPTKSNRTSGDGDHLPVLQIYSILRGIEYGGVKIFGPGLPTSKLPIENWKTAIEACRKLIDKNAGGKEPTFRSGMEVSVDRTPADVIEDLLKSCNGQIIEVAGTLKIRVGAPPASSMTITDDDIVATEDQTFSSFHSMDRTVNHLTANYPNPDGLWKSEAMPPLKNLTYEAEDGGQRYTESVDFNTSPYYEQNLRLMKSAVTEHRRAFKHNIPLPPKYWILEPGETITWNSTRLGYANKDFRIDSIKDRSDVDVELELTEIDSTDHDWDAALDYKAPVPIETLSVITVPAQSILTVNWDVTAITIDSGGHELIPGIKITWITTDLDDIDNVDIEIRRSSETTIDYTLGVPFKQAEHIVYGFLLPQTIYQIRIKFSSISGRPFTWTSWKSVTTDDARLRIDELAGEVLESNLAKALATKIDTKTFATLTDKLIKTQMSAALKAQFDAKLSAPVNEIQLSSALVSKLNAKLNSPVVESELSAAVQVKLNDTGPTVAGVLGDKNYIPRAFRYDNLHLASKTFFKGAYGFYLVDDPDLGDIRTDPTKDGGQDTVTGFETAKSLIVATKETDGSDVNDYLSKRGTGDVFRYWIAQTHWYDYEITGTFAYTDAKGFVIKLIDFSTEGVSPLSFVQKAVSGNPVLFIFTPSSVPTGIKSWLEDKDDVTELVTRKTDIVAVADLESALTALSTQETHLLAVAKIEAELTALAKVETDLVSIAGDKADIDALTTKRTEIITASGLSAVTTALKSLAGDETALVTLAGDQSALSTLAGIQSALSTLAGVQVALSSLATESTNLVSIANDKADIDALTSEKTKILVTAQTALGLQYSTQMTAESTAPTGSGEYGFYTDAGAMDTSGNINSGFPPQRTVTELKAAGFLVLSHLDKDGNDIQTVVESIVSGDVIKFVRSPANYYIYQVTDQRTRANVKGFVITPLDSKNPTGTNVNVDLPDRSVSFDIGDHSGYDALANLVKQSIDLVSIAGDKADIDALTTKRTEIITASGLSAVTTALKSLAGDETALVTLAGDQSALSTLAGIQAALSTLAGVQVALSSLATESTNLVSIANDKADIDALTSEKTKILVTAQTALGLQYSTQMTAESTAPTGSGEYGFYTDAGAMDNSGNINSGFPPQRTVTELKAAGFLVLSHLDKDGNDIQTVVESIVSGDVIKFVRSPANYYIYQVTDQRTRANVKGFVITPLDSKNPTGTNVNVDLPDRSVSFDIGDHSGYDALANLVKQSIDLVSIAGDKADIDALTTKRTEIITASGLSAVTTALKSLAGDETALVTLAGDQSALSTLAGIQAALSTLAGVQVALSSLATESTNLVSIANDKADIDALTSEKTKILVTAQTALGLQYSTQMTAESTAPTGSGEYGFYTDAGAMDNSGNINSGFPPQRTVTELKAAGFLVLSHLDKDGNDIQTVVESIVSGDVIKFVRSPANYYIYQVTDQRTRANVKGFVITPLDSKNPTGTNVNVDLPDRSVSFDIGDHSGYDALANLVKQSIDLVSIAGDKADIDALTTKRTEIITASGLSAVTTALKSLAGDETALVTLAGDQSALSTLAGIQAALSTLAGVQVALSSLATESTNLVSIANDKADIDALTSEKTKILVTAQTALGLQYSTQMTAESTAPTGSGEYGFYTDAGAMDNSGNINSGFPPQRTVTELKAAGFLVLSHLDKDGNDIQTVVESIVSGDVIKFVRSPANYYIYQVTDQRTRANVKGFVITPLDSKNPTGTDVNVDLPDRSVSFDIGDHSGYDALANLVKQSIDLVSIAGDKADIDALTTKRTEIITASGLSAVTTALKSLAGDETALVTLAGDQSALSTLAGIQSALSTLAGVQVALSSLATESTNLVSIANDKADIDALTSEKTKILVTAQTALGLQYSTQMTAESTAPTGSGEYGFYTDAGAMDNSGNINSGFPPQRTVTELKAAGFLVLSHLDKDGNDIQTVVESIVSGDVIKFVRSPANYYIYQVTDQRTRANVKGFVITPLDSKNPTGTDVNVDLPDRSVSFDIGDHSGYDALANLVKQSIDLVSIAGDKADIDALTTKRTEIITASGLSAVTTALKSLAGDETALVTLAGDQSALSALANVRNALTSLASQHADISALVTKKTNLVAVANDWSNIKAVTDEKTAILALASDQGDLAALAQKRTDLIEIAGVRTKIKALTDEETKITALVRANVGDLTYTAQALRYDNLNITGTPNGAGQWAAYRVSDPTSGNTVPGSAVEARNDDGFRNAKSLILSTTDASGANISSYLDNIGNSDLLRMELGRHGHSYDYVVLSRTNKTNFRLFKLEFFGSDTSKFSSSLSGVTIGSLISNTDYDLQIRAKNADGAGAWSNKVSFSTTIVAQLPGQPSFNLSVTSHSVIRLTGFIAPTSDGGANIDRYRIRYKLTAHAGPWTTPTENWASGGYNLTGLTQSTSYDVQVSAHNSVGWSAWSNTKSATTQALVQAPDAPSFPLLTSGNQQIAVRWSAPANNGAIITDYDIRYKVSTVTGWTSKSHIGTALSTTITGLTNSVTYNVQVRAKNSVGSSGWSASSSATPASITTKPAKPNVPTLVVGNKKLDVTWVAPNNGGLAITDYDVRYKLSSTTSWTSKTHVGTALTTSITGLVNNSAYNVQVRAQNSKGESLWSTSATATPVASVPGIPSSIVVSTTSSSVIRMTWALPVDNGGSAVTDYNLQYKLTSATSWTDVARAANHLGTGFNITGLSSSTNYDFRIRAVNSIGDGSWSVPITRTTNAAAGAPAKPATPVLTISSDDLTLTWVIPANGGSAITDQDAELYWRNADGTGSWTKIGGTINISDGTTTSNTWNNQSNGRQYYARVKADNAVGQGTWSDYSNIVTYGAPWVNPSVPTGLSAVAGNTQVVLSWTKSATGSGTIKYDIGYRKGNSGSWTQINSGTIGDSDTHTVTGLDNGDLYQFRVRSVNQPTSTSWRTSAWTSAVSATPSTAWVDPSVPTGLLAAAGDGEVVLSWTKSTSGSGTVVYDIHYRLGTSGSFTLINSAIVGDVSTYTVPSLTNGSAYQFRIRGVNQPTSTSWKTSAWTATVSATPKVASNKPDKVTGLLVYQYTWASAIVVYDTPTVPQGANSVTGVTIEYKKSSDSGWSTRSGSLLGTSRVIPGGGLYTLSQNTTYNFRVKASSTSGDGVYSDQVNLTLQSGVDRPGKPAAPTLTKLSSTSLRVNYTLPNDIGGTALHDVDIRYRKSGTSSWSAASTLYPPIPASHQLDITGLDSGATYQVQVKVDNGSGSNASSTGVGPYSNSASISLASNVVTAPGKPAKPTFSVDSSTVTIAWVAPNPGSSAITHYDAKRENYVTGAWRNLLQSNTINNLSRLKTSWTNGPGNGTWRYAIRAANSDADGPWSDWTDNVVLPVPAAATEISLASDNSSPRGVAFGNSKFWVANYISEEIYVYKEDGTRSSSDDFDLTSANVYPKGITHYNSLLYVLDSSDRKLYAYSETGTYSSSDDIDLGLTAGHAPDGITFGNSKFWVVDNTLNKVFVYDSSGNKLASDNFDLAIANADATGIAYYNSKLWVVDNGDKKVYVYNENGSRSTSDDFDLVSGGILISGICAANGKLWVVDAGIAKITSYTP